MKSIFKIAAFLSIALISSAVGQQISGGGGGGGTPGGSNTQIQYNNSSAFGGSAAFTFDTTNGGTVTLNNSTGANATTLLEVKNSNLTGSPGLLFYGANGRSVIKMAQGNSGGGWGILDYNNTDLMNFGSTFLASGAAWTILGTGTSGNIGDLIPVENVSSIGDATHRVKMLYSVGLTVNGLGSDATHTDNTVCVDSSSGLFYKGSGTIGICLGTSSARYKDAIKPLGPALMQIASLSPKTFRYRKGYGDGGEKDQFGFLAEDVVKVVPKLVGLDTEGRPNSVDMVGMIPMLVKAIQEQQVVIECMRAKKPKC